MPEALRILAFKIFVNLISAAEPILSQPIGQKLFKESHMSLTFPLHSPFKEVLRTLASIDNMMFCLYIPGVGQGVVELNFSLCQLSCSSPTHTITNINHISPAF